MYVPTVFLVIERCAYVPTEADKSHVEAILKSSKKPLEIYRSLLLTKLWNAEIDLQAIAHVYSRMDKDFKENMIVTATFFNQHKKDLKIFFEQFDVTTLEGMFLNELTIRRNEGMDT